MVERLVRNQKVASSSLVSSSCKPCLLDPITILAALQFGHSNTFLASAGRVCTVLVLSLMLQLAGSSDIRYAINANFVCVVLYEEHVCHPLSATSSTVVHLNSVPAVHMAASPPYPAIPEVVLRFISVFRICALLRVHILLATLNLHIFVSQHL